MQCSSQKTVFSVPVYYKTYVPIITLYFCGTARELHRLKCSSVLQDLCANITLYFCGTARELHGFIWSNFTIFLDPVYLFLILRIIILFLKC